MKIRSSVKMVLLLCVLLILLTMGLIFNKSQKKEPVIDEPIISETTAYKHSIVNNTDLNEDVINVIEKYYDAYFESISKLELVNIDDMFSNEIIKHLSNSAISLQIDTRKLYDFDFKMDKAYYDLVIDSYFKKDNTYVISILESDSFFFNFLQGLESNAYDIEVTFYIDEENKISRIDKVQDYWIFFDNVDENIYPTTIEEIDEVYNKYLDLISEDIEENSYKKIDAKTTPYVADKQYNHAYNRELALEYIKQYYHSRNDEYYNYAGIGGNCQNFASQAIHHSGIPMDLVDEKWKYYNDDLDESSDEYGRTSSWNNVGPFYQYVKHNEDGGIVGDTGINMFYGEVGDIIQVGYDKEYIHSTIISKVIDQHILVSANTTDMKDYPVEAYLYPYIRLIKILGYNQ